MLLGARTVPALILGKSLLCLGLWSLGAAAFGAKPLRLTNDCEEMLEFHIPPKGGPFPAKARIYFTAPSIKEETELAAGGTFFLDEGETIFLEDRSSQAGAGGAWESMILFNLTGGANQDMLGGACLAFSFAKAAGSAVGRSRLSFTPPPFGKISQPHQVYVTLDPESKDDHAYVIRPRTVEPKATASEGAGSAGSAGSGDLDLDLKAMDLTDDSVGPEAASVGAGAGETKMAGRTLFTALRASDKQELVSNYQAAYGDWLAYLGKTAAPENPDFSWDSSGKTPLSRAAAARVGRKPVDGFDREVGPRQYEPGLFGAAIDIVWKNRALNFIRRVKMSDQWAAYYLEMSLKDYQALDQ